MGMSEGKAKYTSSRASCQCVANTAVWLLDCFVSNAVLLHLIYPPVFTTVAFWLVKLANVTLTQWSRACRKSNSSSVQSSAVIDREPTLVSHSSRRDRVWTQCSASSHFCRITSRGSFNRICSIQSMNLHEYRLIINNETHSADNQSVLSCLKPGLTKSESPTSRWPWTSPDKVYRAFRGERFHCLQRANLQPYFLQV